VVKAAVKHLPLIPPLVDVVVEVTVGTLRSTRAGGTGAAGAMAVRSAYVRGGSACEWRRWQPAEACGSVALPILGWGLSTSLLSNAIALCACSLRRHASG
jgi:hypothetical protein